MTEQPNKEVTMQDLGALPLRALVGFTIRCARRLLPVLQGQEDSPEKQAILLKSLTALEVAEAFSLGKLTTEPEQIALLAEQTYQAANDVSGLGQYSVFAAGHVANTVALAHCYLSQREKADPMELVAAAWGTYRVLLGFINGPISRDYFTGEMVEDMIRADFDRLLALEAGEFGELGEPIDPSEEGTLGRLWPEGPPSWY